MQQKLIVITVMLAWGMNTTQAQVGIGTSAPHASAQLDVESNDKGMLVPRLTTAQRSAIATPAKGLLVFDNDTNSFWYYNGSSWQNMAGASAASGWSLNGNAGTTTGNFIGTTDVNPLRFKINNVTAGEIAINNNTTLGLSAGSVLTGANSTGIGAYALANSTGNNNTALGYSSLYGNLSGYSNVAIGTDALYNNSVRNNLVAIGDSALYNNTGIGGVNPSLDGTENVAVGSKALYSNTIGFRNTANGHHALYSNTTGISNTASGRRTLYSNTTGNRNTANGREALYSNTTGDENTANGTEALYSNTTGSQNTANGAFALARNTGGQYNTANGAFALNYNTTGFRNTANGTFALVSNTEGYYNTANGSSALYNNTTGSHNTANGEAVLYSNTTGFENTAIGREALYSNTTGFENTANGRIALYYNTTGIYNTAIGSFSGFALPVSVNNVSCLGRGTGFSTTGSNHVNIGNVSVTYIGGQVNWSTYSDGRIKNNVQENVPGLNFIKALRPVTYNLDIIKQDAIANEGTEEHMQKMLVEKRQKANGDANALQKMEQETKQFASLKLNRAKPAYPEQFDIEKQTQTGFIAQEVEAAAKKTGYNFSAVLAPKDGKGLYSLRYAEFVVPLVKAVQEQQQQIELLVQQNQELLKRLVALEKKE